MIPFVVSLSNHERNRFIQRFLGQDQDERYLRPVSGKSVEAGLESVSAVFPKGGRTMQTNWNRSRRGE